MQKLAQTSDKALETLKSKYDTASKELKVLKLREKRERAKDVARARLGFKSRATQTKPFRGFNSITPVSQFN